MKKCKPIIIPIEVTPNNLEWDEEKWLEYTKKQKIKFENI